MKSFFAAIAIVLLAGTAFAQNILPGYSYTYSAISMPADSLAAGSDTNLTSGWTATTYTTNTSVLWDSSSSAFVTNSVITTNSATTYANFDTQGQRYAPLQFEFKMSGSSTGALDFIIARSVTGVNYDTANNILVGFTGNGTTKVVGITNIDMGGFGYGRIVGYTNTDGARYSTNLSIYIGKYPGRIRN